MHALLMDGDFNTGFYSRKKIFELVSDLDGTYTEALCGTGLNSGLWILARIEDDPSVMVDLIDTKALVKRSIEMKLPAASCGVSIQKDAPN